MTGFTLDYFELPSADNAASRAFFAGAFGWRFVSYGPGYDEVQGAGLSGGIDGSAGRSAAPLLVIRTDDLEAAHAAVLAAGGTVTRAPYDYPGGRRFEFREPGGVELAIYLPQE